MEQVNQFKHAWMGHAYTYTKEYRTIYAGQLVDLLRALPPPLGVGERGSYYDCQILAKKVCACVCVCVRVFVFFLILRWMRYNLRLNPYVQRCMYPRLRIAMPLAVRAWDIKVQTYFAYPLVQMGENVKTKTSLVTKAPPFWLPLFVLTPLAPLSNLNIYIYIFRWHSVT